MFKLKYRGLKSEAAIWNSLEGKARGIVMFLSERMNINWGLG